MLVFHLFGTTYRRVLEASTDLIAAQQTAVFLSRSLTAVKGPVIDERGQHSILTPTAASADRVTGSIKSQRILL